METNNPYVSKSVHSNFQRTVISWGTQLISAHSVLHPMSRALSLVAMPVIMGDREPIDRVNRDKYEWSIQLPHPTVQNTLTCVCFQKIGSLAELRYIYIYMPIKWFKEPSFIKDGSYQWVPIQSRVPCLPSRGPYSTPTGRRSCQSTKWEGVCHLARKHTRTYGNLRPLLSWCLRTDPFSKKFKAGPSIWFKISAIKWFKEPSFIKDGSYQWLSHPE